MRVIQQKQDAEYFKTRAQPLSLGYSQQPDQRQLEEDHTKIMEALKKLQIDETYLHPNFADRIPKSIEPFRAGELDNIEIPKTRRRASTLDTYTARLEKYLIEHLKQLQPSDRRDIGDEDDPQQQQQQQQQQLQQQQQQ